jgi:hypothetical protein
VAISDDELDQMQAAIVAAMSAPGIDERIPDWTTADDLSRIGIEALIDTDPLGRTLSSRGNIRITGDGVTGSSAKVNEIARVMTGFQRLATAVGAAIDVFAAGNDIGPAPQESEFVQQLGDMGPRTASAVRDLAKTLERADFDIDIEWKQPSRATRRVSVTSRAARHMAYVFEHANLDEQPVAIIGEYLTVSAVSSWVIQQDDGDAITVKLGRVDPGQTRGLAVGERIRVQAIVKSETTPGGNTKITYTAQSFDRLDPLAQQRWVAAVEDSERSHPAVTLGLRRKAGVHGRAGASGLGSSRFGAAQNRFAVMFQFWLRDRRSRSLFDDAPVLSVTEIGVCKTVTNVS